MIKTKIKSGVLSALFVWSAFIGPLAALAQDPLADPLTGAIREPATAAQMTAGDPARDPLGREWAPSRLLTAGLQFTVRGREALAWALQMDGFGFDSPAIRQTYQKVLTIVNSLFILGLLAIAGLWLFNIFIPRRYLRRVMAAYAIAVIFVNFALPVNRLLIDGTNLLQQAFLVREGGAVVIGDIVATPAYDATEVFYQTAAADPETRHTLTLEWEGADGRAHAPLAQLAPELDDTETVLSGIIGGVASRATLKTSRNQATRHLEVPVAAPVTVRVATGARAPTEFSVFAFAMLALTGLATFGLAALLVLRVVILWALLVLSPLLLFLAIWSATRGYFYNWLSLYGRWLFIGPLAALGIALTVNIWKIAGIPIESAYTGGTTFGVLSNLAFFLPGRQTPNTLSTTPEMMEVLIFLFMLYMPLFFAIALTRQKRFESLMAAAHENTVGRFRERNKRSVGSGIETGTNGSTGTNEGTKGGSAAGAKTQGVAGQFRHFFNTQFGKLTQTVMPAGEGAGGRTTGAGSVAPHVESASHFLPENLSRMEPRDLLGLLSRHKESRHAHEETIAKLASPVSVPDPHERKKVEAVRQEISQRAAKGDTEAIRIQNEIETRRAEGSGGAERAAGPAAVNQSGTTIEKISESHTSSGTTVQQPMAAPPAAKAAKTEPVQPKKEVKDATRQDKKDDDESEDENEDENEDGGEETKKDENEIKKDDNQNDE